MTASAFVERPSPNHDARPLDTPVDILLLHYTGMESAAAALARLCDPAARVSAHYCVDEDGTTYRLVPEDRRAWHAGDSAWAGARDVNARSIGVELVNPGHAFGYRPFPDAQMTALVALCGEIVARHPIPAHRVLGHSDVAPGRRMDPGELFDWGMLARAGIGLAPPPPASAPAAGGGLGPGAAGGAVRALQRRLAAFGYGVAETGDWDVATGAAVTAFQRHFRQRRVDGVADGETERALAALLDQVPAAGAVG